MKAFLIVVFQILFFAVIAQNVKIPDPNFKAYLLGHTAINVNGDDKIQASEAAVYDGAIWLPTDSVYDLTGIEAFTSLTELHVKGPAPPLNGSPEIKGGLTMLDLSHNLDLEIVDCIDNQLISLILGQNTVLTSLKAQRNYLTFLDVSNNTNLWFLDVNRNNLIILDISQNEYLTEFKCSWNELTCLNIANGNNLCAYEYNWIEQNPYLTCIEVDDIEWTANNCDLPSYTSLNCYEECGALLNYLSPQIPQDHEKKIYDLMGRETLFKPNTHLIYVYSNGFVERVYSIE